MKCPTPNSLAFSILILLNRAALGMSFVLAGVGKIQGGVEEFVDGFFRDTTPPWLPDWFATPYGYALPFVEVAAGALLVLGLFGRIGAGVCALMLLSFLIAVGIGHEQLPFHPNVIFLALAVLLFVAGTGGISVDAIWCRGCRIKSS